MAGPKRIQDWMQKQQKRHPPDNLTTEPVRPLVSTEGREFGSGMTDQQVEAMATEDGRSRVHVKSVCGKNTAPRGIELLHACWRVCAGLIANDYRVRLQPLDEQLEELVPQQQDAEQQVLNDLNADHGEDRCVERLRQKITAAGYHLPHRWAFVLLVAGFLALVFGDWDPIASAFQVFGLSDKPWIPFLKFTDPVHLAAAGATFSLLLLAHQSGVELRKLVHFLQRRHEELDPAIKAAMKPNWVWPAITAACLGAALPVLLGINAVRGDYLARKHHQGEMLAFVEIQAGVLAAGLILAMGLAHPFAREWADTIRSKRDSERRLKASSQLHQELIGAINGLFDLRLSLLAQAGHHFHVARDDALRQCVLYVRRVILAQPEPVEEELFPKTLPELETKTGKELAAFLVGIAAVTEFTRPTMERVLKRQAELRERLQKLRDSGGSPPRTVWQEVPAPPEHATKSNGGGGGS